MKHVAFIIPPCCTSSIGPDSVCDLHFIQGSYNNNNNIQLYKSNDLNLWCPPDEHGLPSEIGSSEGFSRMSSRGAFPTTVSSGLVISDLIQHPDFC